MQHHKELLEMQIDESNRTLLKIKRTIGCVWDEEGTKFQIQLIEQENYYWLVIFG